MACGTWGSGLGGVCRRALQSGKRGVGCRGGPCGDRRCLCSRVDTGKIGRRPWRLRTASGNRRHSSRFRLPGLGVAGGMVQPGPHVSWCDRDGALGLPYKGTSAPLTRGGLSSPGEFAEVVLGTVAPRPSAAFRPSSHTPLQSAGPRKRGRPPPSPGPQGARSSTSRGLPRAPGCVPGVGAESPVLGVGVGGRRRCSNFETPPLFTFLSFNPQPAQ